ncbi:MAG: hypothetical protein JST70_18805 [Bacteroidetes bacterium]|nr:hypothetical protein [Bacteroidota bacterium]
MESGLLKLSVSKITHILIIVISIVSSGVLTIFSLNKSFFASQDTLKLALLACAITTPVWAFNSLLIAILKNRLFYTSEIHLMFAGFFGAIATLTVFYLPAILAALHYIHSVKNFALATAVFEISIVFWLVLTKKLVTVERKRMHDNLHK